MGGCSREGGVQAGERIHHPQTVRADNAHPSPPGLFKDLSFQHGAFRSDLLESRRDDDGSLHTGFHAFRDDLRDSGGGRDDDGQVDRVRQVADAGVGFDAQDIGPLGVDGKDRASEGAADQIPDDGAADASNFFGSADHGNGLWRKDGLQ